MKECVSLIMSKLSRIKIIQKVLKKSLRQSEPANILNVRERQVRRLVRSYKNEGATGLISRKRGASENHCLQKGLKELAIGLIEDNYRDFGPTLAQEKLKEVHGLKISVSTVRELMIKKELWSPKRLTKKRIFQYRERRSRKGEMMVARFEPRETREGYFYLMEDHVKTYGRPVALYGPARKTPFTRKNYKISKKKKVF